VILVTGDLFRPDEWRQGLEGGDAVVPDAAVLADDPRMDIPLAAGRGTVVPLQLLSRLQVGAVASLVVLDGPTQIGLALLSRPHTGPASSGICCTALLAATRTCAAAGGLICGIAPPESPLGVTLVAVAAGGEATEYYRTRGRSGGELLDYQTRPGVIARLLADLTAHPDDRALVLVGRDDVDALAVIVRQRGVTCWSDPESDGDPQQARIVIRPVDAPLAKVGPVARAYVAARLAGRTGWPHVATVVSAASPTTREVHSWLGGGHVQNLTPAGVRADFTRLDRETRRVLTAPAAAPAAYAAEHLGLVEAAELYRRASTWGVTRVWRAWWGRSGAGVERGYPPSFEAEAEVRTSIKSIREQITTSAVEAAAITTPWSREELEESRQRGLPRRDERAGRAISELVDLLGPGFVPTPDEDGEVDTTLVEALLRGNRRGGLRRMIRTFSTAWLCLGGHSACATARDRECAATGYPAHHEANTMRRVVALIIARELLGDAAVRGIFSPPVNTVFYQEKSGVDGVRWGGGDEAAAEACLARVLVAVRAAGIPDDVLTLNGAGVPTVKDFSRWAGMHLWQGLGLKTVIVGRRTMTDETGKKTRPNVYTLDLDHVATIREQASWTMARALGWSIDPLARSTTADDWRIAVDTATGEWRAVGDSGETRGLGVPQPGEVSAAG